MSRKRNITGKTRAATPTIGFVDDVRSLPKQMPGATGVTAIRFLRRLGTCRVAAATADRQNADPCDNDHHPRDDE